MKDENKYKLQIRTNRFKKSGQYEGNGIYGNYVEGNFEDGTVFLIYPFRAIFYLLFGREGFRYEVEKVYVDDLDDILNYVRDDQVFIKYTNILLDKHIEQKGKPLPQIKEYE